MTCPSPDQGGGGPTSRELLLVLGARIEFITRGGALASSLSTWAVPFGFEPPNTTASGFFFGDPALVGGRVALGARTELIVSGG